MTPNWLANGANGIVCLIRWKKKCKERANKNSNKTWNRKEYQSSNTRQKGMSKEEVRKSILCFESPCYPSYSIANPWTFQSGQIIPRYSKYFVLFIGQNQQNQLYLISVVLTSKEPKWDWTRLDQNPETSRNHLQHHDTEHPKLR